MGQKMSEPLKEQNKTKAALELQPLSTDLKQSNVTSNDNSPDPLKEMLEAKMPSQYDNKSAGGDEELKTLPKEPLVNKPKTQ